MGKYDREFPFDVIWVAGLLRTIDLHGVASPPPRSKGADRPVEIVRHRPGRDRVTSGTEIYSAAATNDRFQGKNPTLELGENAQSSTCGTAGRVCDGA